jgi:hypothetical protein
MSTGARRPVVVFSTSDSAGTLPPRETFEFLDSGGSMVAKLKLKGIDGRAPPGVEPAA